MYVRTAPLAGETANGSFPDVAVSTMGAICTNAEQAIEGPKRFAYIRNFTPKPMTDTEALCSSAAQIALDVAARAIVVVTTSGRGAYLVSKYRPVVPVFVVTSD